MHGVLNHDVSGLHHQAARFLTARYRLPTISEMYFYAYFQRMIGQPGGGIRMELLVCSVYVGQPEHVYPGQVLFMDYSTVIGITENRESLSELQEGERYFFRAQFIRRFAPAGVRYAQTLPMRGSRGDVVTMRPLYRPGPTVDEILFFHAPGDAAIDFSLPQFAHIPGEIEMIERSQRGILLQTTRDMAAMPQVISSVTLRAGRMITYEDYLHARPVITIDVNLAHARQLNIGDTITMSVPMHQNYSGAVAIPGFAVPMVELNRDHPYRYYDSRELNLEIVGITQFRALNAPSAQSMFAFIPDSVLPADLYIEWVQRIVENRQWVYLPSLEFGVDHIPDVWYNFVLADSLYYEAFREEFWLALITEDLDLAVLHMDSTNFWISANPILLAITFNAGIFWFVLLVVLGLCAFLFLRQRFRDIAIQRALGTNTRLIMARLIIATTLLSLPAIALGSVLAWDFALGEAADTLVGFSEIYEDTFEPTEFELMWREQFGDRPLPAAFAQERQISLAASLDTIWLILLIGIVFVLTIIMIFFGGARILRTPVLGLLQGNSGKPATARRSAKIITNTEPIVITNYSIPTDIPAKSAAAAFVNAIALLRRLISRAPVKSGLGAAIALLFVFALGWLQSSIDTTYSEIHRVYDTTIVRAQILPNHEAARMRYVDDIIPASTVNLLMESGFVYDMYREASHLRSFVLAPEPDGTMFSHWFFRLRIFRSPGGFVSFSRHENLRQVPNVIRHNRDIFDFTLGVSSLDTFLTRHVPSAETMALFELVEDGVAGDIIDMQVRGAPGAAYIIFAEGFGTDAFDETEYSCISEPIPMIISMQTARARGIWLGDDALLAWASAIAPMASSSLADWPYVRTKVIGVHNSQIHINGMADTAMIPYWAFHELFGRHPRYNYLDIAINPAYNRYLNEVRNEFNTIVNRLTAVEDMIHSIFEPLPVRMLFHDIELRNLVASLTQILTLLTLLYPIAIVLAIVIGAGLAMLLTLQNTKNAAVMRVLGSSKKRTAFMLWCEQMIICAIGLVLGLVAMLFLGLTATQMATLSGLYLIGSIFGAAFGAFIVTNKAPLELLQVRE